MLSTLTLANLEARVSAYLFDPTNAVWTTAVIDAAIRAALQEYSQANPLTALGTVTLASANREVSLSTLTGLYDVVRAWLPYTSATPEQPPAWARFLLYNNAGTFSLYLDVPTAPVAGQVLRVFYLKNHVLNGLDGGAATTFPQHAEATLLIGALGHALMARAIDLNEDATQNAHATPNYVEMARDYLTQFRLMLGAPPVPTPAA
jgi:hypothetical protein